MAIRVQETASLRLDEIYRYTRDRWGEAQAEIYITGLFAAFEQIDPRGVMSRPVAGRVRSGRVFLPLWSGISLYWLRLSNGDIGIVTIPSRADASDGSLQGGFRLIHCPKIVFPDKA